MRKSGVIGVDKGWLVVVLWLLVVISALAVVRSTHEVRSRLNQLELLRRGANQLHVEWGQYLLEQSAWSAYSRIEQKAEEQLKMVVPQGEQLVMVQQ